ncbi:MAG: rane protein [Prosthecobacter sp.]|nr:rane protein [Prosthecobacter sp.]
MGFLSIALGASGAHGEVHDRLVATGTLANWETAVQYHLPHAVVLLLLTLLASAKPQMVWAWRMFFVGILLFSGSLYLLAYTGTKWLGAITPLGGLSFMIGWVLIAMSARGKQVG